MLLPRLRASLRAPCVRAPLLPSIHRARHLCGGGGAGSPSALLLPAHQSLAKYLEGLKARHAEIERELADASSGFSVDTMKELSRLTPIMEARTKALELATEVAELRELASDTASEAELRELARSELEEGEAGLAAVEEELIALLVPPEEGDERGALLEVRAGVGGLEAGLFAGDLLGMYEKFAKRMRWRFELLAEAENDQGGIKDATFSISGEGAYGMLKGESGVHRVQRVPATESLGRVHTSTAVVVVLPEVEDSGLGRFEIPESEIEVETYRSGGKGGQSVNTTDSAVRMTHKPTGIKVEIQNERSQHQNKARALQVLTARVKAHFERIARAESDRVRDEVDSTGARSERIRTYNFPDDRVSDHRLSGAKFGLPRMLEGAMLEELATELKEQQVGARREAFVRQLSREEEEQQQGAAGGGKRGKRGG